MCIQVRKSGSVSPEAADSSSSSSDRGKEYVVMTDADCQLYHFTVEGHTIKDGTKVISDWLTQKILISDWLSQDTC